MSSGINSVSQSGIKELLRQRLQTPEKYIGTPLIIWRSYYYDGIQVRLVKDVLKERNTGHSKEEWKGVLVNPKSARKERLAFVAIDTLADYDETLAHFNDIPLVVYAAMSNPDDSILKDFPNAEQYVFTPDFKEWSLWFASRAKGDRFLLDFIELGAGGNIENIIYRWYNYFNAGCNRRLKANGVKPDVNTGCDYPSCWQLVMSRLYMARKMARVKCLHEITEDIYNIVFPPGISRDLALEFRNYITEREL